MDPAFRFSCWIESNSWFVSIFYFKF
jgi:hypothetical protein